MTETEDIGDDAGDSAGVNEDVDDAFANRVLDSLKETFWDPEIGRRGGPDEVGPIHKALAILMPGQAVEIRFNDEFELVARAKLNSGIERGEPVTIENLDELEGLEPVGVDPNAGWVAWLALPDGRQFAQFDFIRNRQRSLQLLRLADDYLVTAESALPAGRLGPALENAMAAAELAITAQTYSFSTDEPSTGTRRNAHSARRHWTKVQVGLGNTTPDAHDTLLALHNLRGASRYGEGEVSSVEQAKVLLTSVRQLVQDASMRIGQPLRTQDPAFVASLNL